MKRAASCVLATAAALAGCAYGPGYVGYDQGYGYGSPSGYGNYGAAGYYGAPAYYGAAPVYLYGSTSVDRRSHVPPAERRFGRGGGYGDIDHDGIPNNADPDRD